MIHLEEMSNRRRREKLCLAQKEISKKNMSFYVMEPLSSPIVTVSDKCAIHKLKTRNCKKKNKHLNVDVREKEKKAIRTLGVLKKCRRFIITSFKKKAK